MAVRAVRGAIQVDARRPRTRSWTARPSWSPRCCSATAIDPADLISIVFTATPDLTAEFPAYAARLLGLTDVPLLCTTEIAVPGAMPRVLRLMAHVETALRARPRSGTSTCAARPRCAPTCPSSRVHRSGAIPVAS